MGEINTVHKDLANGRWAEMSFAKQMGNIGSEVSRSLKAQAAGKESRMNSAIDRALELFDLSLSCNHGTKLYELCRAREVFCDYFFGGNSFHTDPKMMQRYYDSFVAYPYSGS